MVSQHEVIPFLNYPVAEISSGVMNGGTGSCASADERGCGKIYQGIREFDPGRRTGLAPFIEFACTGSAYQIQRDTVRRSHWRITGKDWHHCDCWGCYSANYGGTELSSVLARVEPTFPPLSAE